MPGPTNDSPFQIQAPNGAPAVASLGPNTRVVGQFGFLATAVDTVLLSPLPPPPYVIANWVAPNARSFASGVPLVSQSAQGIAYVTVPATPPIAAAGVPIITAPDTRVISS